MADQMHRLSQIEMEYLVSLMEMLKDVNINRSRSPVPPWPTSQTANVSTVPAKIKMLFDPMVNCVIPNRSKMSETTAE
jgi:hypothetical protein